LSDDDDPGEQILPFKPVRAIKSNITPTSGGLEVEDVSAFLTRLADAPELVWLIDGLVPAEGLCLWHGQPRDFKSLCAIEVALALATGRAPFGAERFSVRRPVKVAFFAEEDPERLFAQRLRWMLANTQMPAEGMLFMFIRNSITFDDEFNRRDIIKAIEKCGAESVIFDPLRSFTAMADKGPADFAPVTRFLRRIQNETQCKSGIIIHHDIKPMVMAAANMTQRSRSHDASGGGIFSIAECPVAFSKLAWNKVAVYPEDYKLTGNPRPFQVVFESDSFIDANGAPNFGTWVRPRAETKEEQAMKEESLHDKVVSYLAQNEATHAADPKKLWVSSRDIETTTKLRHGQAVAILDAMLAAGKVTKITGKAAKVLGRAFNASLWRGIPNAAVPGLEQSAGTATPGTPSGSCPSPVKGTAAPRGLVRAQRAPAAVVQFPGQQDDPEEGA